MLVTNIIRVGTDPSSLIDDGVERLRAQVAAAAVLAGLAAAMFEWSLRDDVSLGDAIEHAVTTLEGTRG